MTTQLPERLRDLAEDAPDALSAGDLWRSGRRRHRRRLATAGAVLGAVVALTAGVGYGDRHSSQPGPATPPATRSGPMQIPDRLFNPSPWTPTTRTPGRLVALLSATRDHFPFGSDGTALVGVAAGSQTYRFLDLPGQAPNSTDAQLSPDGRHVAYWIAGAPGAPALNPQSLVGFAVLDLVTGKVERHEVQTRFGLAPQSLTWLNTSTLAMVADHFASLRPNDYAGRTRTYFFDVGSPSSYSALAPATVLDIPVRTWPAWVCAPVCPGRYAEMVGDRRLRVFRSGENSSESDIRFSAPATSVVYDPHHHLVAATEGNIDVGGPTAGPLVVGRVDHGRVGFTSVPGGRSYQQVMTWVDPAHVTTMRQTLHGLVYDLVDVRTGARRPLVSKPWYAFTIAADALQRPSTVPGIAPPSPWNPRWVALGALGALLLAGGAVVVVRRSHVRG